MDIKTDLQIRDLKNTTNHLSKNHTTEKDANAPNKGREQARQMSQATTSTPQEILKILKDQVFKDIKKIQDIYQSIVFDIISDSSYQSIRSLCGLQENDSKYLDVLLAACTISELQKNIENISEAREPLELLNNKIKIFLEEINTAVLNNLKANKEDIRNTLNDTEWINFLNQIEKLHEIVFEMHSNLCTTLNDSNKFDSQQFNLNDFRANRKDETSIFKITNPQAVQRFQKDQSKINEQVIPLLESCCIKQKSLKSINGTYNILSLGAGAAHDAPAILEELGKNSKYYAVDIDPRALKLGQGMMSDPRIEFVEKDISTENALSKLPEASLLLIRNPQFSASDNFSFKSTNASGTNMVKLMLENGLKKLDKGSPVLITSDNKREYQMLIDLIDTMPEIKIIQNGENPNGWLRVASVNFYPESSYTSGRDQYFIFCTKTPHEKAQ
jgi:hypothetical protein